MEFVQYFDKNPLTAFAYGPSGSGIIQPQPFSVEWSGSFNPALGATISGHSGRYFIAELDRGDTTEFSFCFDSQSNPWLAYGNGSQINISFVSGSSKTNYSFSGTSPALFHNSILKTGVSAAYCFYLKENTSIYFKRSSDNFSAEHLFYSGDTAFKRIQMVRKLPEFYYRYGLYLIDMEANGHKFYSSPFEPMFNEVVNNFEQDPTGTVSYVKGWMVEGDYPSGYFLNTAVVYGDNFETTPTGTITSLTSGYNMVSGYFI